MKVYRLEDVHHEKRSTRTRDPGELAVMSRGDNIPEVERLDLAQLGSLLRERRGHLSLRQAAADAGVSFSTFTRIEGGSQPDLTSFTLLCAWLGVSPTQFFTPAAMRTADPVEEAISHLNSDPRLRPEAADKISGVLRSMYEALAEVPEPRPVVACHLRAAGLLRPGVPGRLNSILTQMHDEIAGQIESGHL